MFTAIWAFYCNDSTSDRDQAATVVSRMLSCTAKPMPFSQLLNCGFCILHTSLQRIYSLIPQELNLSKFWLTHLYTVFHSYFFPFKETLPLSLKHFWRDLGILGAILFQVSFCTKLNSIQCLFRNDTDFTFMLMVIICYVLLNINNTILKANSTMGYANVLYWSRNLNTN